MSLPKGIEVGAFARKLKFAAAGGLLAAVTLLSTGCGWQPLYGPTASGAQLSDVMRTVDITTVPGRVGQRVRNELIFKTTGGSGQGQSKYRLDIAIRETLQHSMATTTGATEGQVLQVYTEFRLIRLSDNQVVLEGHTNARAAYDKNQSVFADQRAKIDAENRAANTISEAIATRLASYFSAKA